MTKKFAIMGGTIFVVAVMMGVPTASYAQTTSASDSAEAVGTGGTSISSSSSQSTQNSASATARSSVSTSGGSAGSASASALAKSGGTATANANASRQPSSLLRRSSSPALNRAERKAVSAQRAYKTALRTQTKTVRGKEISRKAVRDLETAQRRIDAAKRRAANW
jgi:hypothetical protein